MFSSHKRGKNANPESRFSFWTLCSPFLIDNPQIVYYISGHLPSKTILYRLINHVFLTITKEPVSQKGIVRFWTLYAPCDLIALLPLATHLSTHAPTLIGWRFASVSRFLASNIVCLVSTLYPVRIILLISIFFILFFLLRFNTRILFWYPKEFQLWEN